MDLVVDIGNTSTKIFLFHDDTPIEQRMDERGDIIALLADICASYGVKNAIVSTTKYHDQKLAEQIKRIVPNTIFFDPATTPVPIINNYHSPKTLGADRLAAAVGAVAKYGKRDMLIMDFGTALTVENIVNGEYMGGNISLGLSSRFNSLSAMTDRLPRLEPSLDFMKFGTTTTAAIEAGVMQSMLFEVEGYLANNKEKTIIFTGGEAFYFEKLLKIPIFVDCELVPFGLNRILKYNVNKI